MEVDPKGEHPEDNQPADPIGEGQAHLVIDDVRPRGNEEREIKC